MDISAQSTNEVTYKFTQSESGYSFMGSFKIKADPKCLLEISYNYEHIRSRQDFSIVDYYQQCQLSETSIKQFYLNRVEKEAIKFIHEYAIYAGL